MIKKVLEYGLNQFLKLDPESSKLLKPLLDKTICLEFTRPKMKVPLYFSEQNIKILSDPDLTPDTVIKGSLASFIRLSLAPAHSVTLKELDITLSGDPELAEHFNTVFKKLDIDWEGCLAHYTDDLIAHSIFKMLKRTYHVGGLAIENLLYNVKEFAQEEKDALPTQFEVEDFMNDLDELRMNLERFEARVQQKKAEQKDA